MTDTSNDSSEDSAVAPRSERPSTEGTSQSASRPEHARARRVTAPESSPAVIGKFRTHGLLGRGGQGSVYSAWDPELKRSVAIKVLHSDAPGRDNDEARNAVRVNHPNVVAIYEGTKLAGRTAVVMELLPGGTLTEWAAAKKRTVNELVARFLEAGRGLAAIHERNLVHRDFKPDNVLLKENGTATVTDFGLTREETDEASRSGTRHYMAPELANYGNASAKSDQYAFCVSMYRLLTGEYPSPVYDGELRLPNGLTMPKWIRVILARGLAGNPVERFPSMLELLKELELNPEVRRRALLRQLLVAAALGLVTITSLVVLLRETPDERALRQCGERAAQLEDQLWSPRIVGRIQDHFTAVAGTAGTQTFERVRLRLEPEVKSLVRASTEACAIKDPLERATTQSCLKARSALLRTTGDFLATLEPGDVPGVLRTLSLEVKPVESCRSSQRLPTALNENDADRALLVQLAPVSLLRSAGRFDDARRLSVEVAHRAEDERAPWAEAEALLYAGLTLADQQDSTAAGQLERAVAAAERIGADELRARGWIALMGVHVTREEFPLASRAAAHATAIVQRLGAPDLLAGSLLNAEGARLYALGELTEANEKFRAYRELLLRTRTPEDPMVRHADNNILLTGTEDQGEGLKELVRKTLVELGPEHPETLSTRSNFASVLLSNGLCDEGLREISSVIEVRRAGPQHLRVTLAKDYLLRSRITECQGRHAVAAMESWVGLKLLRERSPPDGMLHRELVHRFELLTAVTPDALDKAIKEDVFVHGRDLLAQMPRGDAALDEISKEICSLGLPSPDPKRPCPKTD